MADVSNLDTDFTFHYIASFEHKAIVTLPGDWQSTSAPRRGYATIVTININTLECPSIVIQASTNVQF
jgi:hypothetical protein